MSSESKSIALVLLLVLGSSCAKKRGEETAPAPATTVSALPSAEAARGPKKGKNPDKLCRYESATATSQLEIVGVSALDLSLTPVKEALNCSGGGLQECAGAIGGDKKEPVKGEAPYKLVVDKRGMVSEAKLDGKSTLPADVTDCTTAILKKLDFPAPDKESTEVRFSLKFSARDQADVARFAGARAMPGQVSMLSGKVDTDKTLNVATGKVRGCYLLGLEGDAKLAGKVTYKVTVGEDGSVQSADEEQSGNLTPDLLKCVDVVLRSLKFPEPEGKTKASFTGSWTLAKGAP